MKMWTLFFAALCVSVWAHAEGPCKSDMEKFCSGVAKGRAMVSCLKSHQAELSSSCLSSYQDMKARMRHTFEACQEDAEKYCSDVKPGGGALPKCLKSNDAKLSKACKEAMHKKGPRKR